MADVGEAERSGLHRRPAELSILLTDPFTAAALKTLRRQIGRSYDDKKVRNSYLNMVIRV